MKLEDLRKLVVVLETTLSQEALGKGYGSHEYRAWEHLVKAKDQLAIVVMNSKDK